MDATKQKILSTLDANSGRMPYQALIDTLTFEERQFYPVAIRQLKAEGTAKQQNRALPEGGSVFEVFRVGAPVPSSPTPPVQGGN